jgi:hypothetical protein
MVVSALKGVYERVKQRVKQRVEQRVKESQVFFKNKNEEPMYERIRRS